MDNPHLATEPIRLGPDPADAAATVVAVHGRGQTPQYMIEFFVKRIDDPSISWVLPAAADQSWYPEGFMAPPEANQPLLDCALQVTAGIESSLAAVSAERVIWAGFSQGACLVCEHVARDPKRRGGLLVLTGGRIGPAGTDLSIAGDLGATPVYFGVGDPDDWVPVTRVVETADAFASAGADVTVDVFSGRDHEICDDEITRARQVIIAACR